MSKHLKVVLERYCTKVHFILVCMWVISVKIHPEEVCSVLIYTCCSGRLAICPTTEVLPKDRQPLLFHFSEEWKIAYLFTATEISNKKTVLLQMYKPGNPDQMQDSRLLKNNSHTSYQVTWVRSCSNIANQAICAFLYIKCKEHSWYLWQRCFFLELLYFVC